MLRLMLVALLSLGMVGCAAGGEEDLAAEEDPFNPKAPIPTPAPAPGSGAKAGFKVSPGKLQGTSAGMGINGNVTMTRTELTTPSLGMRLSISRGSAIQQ